MEKLKIYLSGAITNRENYKKEFEDAKEIVQKYYSIYYDSQDVEIINPVDTDHLNESGRWEYYLKKDIKMLVDCDILIDIENCSQNLRGAMLEKMICIGLDIPIKKISSLETEMELRGI